MAGPYHLPFRNLWLIGGFAIIQLSCLVASQTPPNLTSIGCIGPRCYYFVEEKLSWDEANQTCRSYNDTYLASIPDNETRVFLHDNMIMKGIDKLWFGAHEVFYDQWTWLNDEMYYGEVREFHNPGNVLKPFCGAYNDRQTSENVQGSSCSERKRYLCTKDVIMDTSNQDMYYKSDEYKPLPWFSAREACLERGMNLATESGNSTAKISQLLKEEPDNFWIGLRKSRFLQEEDGMGLNYFYFEVGQPNYMAENCLQMTSVGEFNDKECKTEIPFVCEWVNTTMVKPMETKAREEKEPIDQFALILGLSVGGGVLLIIAMIVCIILLVKRPKRGGRRRRPSMANDLMENSFYETSIKKTPTPQAERKHHKEVVYDVTNQFNYIKKDPVPLPTPTPTKAPSSRKFSFLYTKVAKKKGKGLQEVDGIHANVYENSGVENVPRDDMYQNTQAALPHYR